MKLKPFGVDLSANYHQQTLDEIIGHLESSIDREVERLEGEGADITGSSPLAIRLSIVEEAKGLLEVAINSDVKQMRAVHSKFKS